MPSAAPDPNAEYERLRSQGAGGWGGASFARRRDGWMRTVARLRREARFPAPPARLLELGCGNGMAAALFAVEGYEIEGVELSGEAVDWAREAFATAGLAGAFTQGDVCAMPFYEDGRFDVVIDGNCLHCVMDAARAKCLAEARRVLRPGGVFVVSSMCGEPKSQDARSRFDAASRRLFENGRPWRMLLPAEEIAQEVRAAGFDVVWREISENAWWDHLTLLAVAPGSRAARARDAGP